MNRSLSPLRPRRIRDHRGRKRRRWYGDFDPLEGRALLAAFTWISPVDGNFNDPTKWVGPNNINAVPGPGDDASSPGGSYTITSSSSVTVNSFQGDGALDVTGGTFSVSGTLNAASSLVNNLSVAAGASFHAGGKTTLGGAGVISGNLDAGSGATLTLAGSANAINLDAGSTMTGAGTFLIASNVSVNAAVTGPTSTVLDSGNSLGLEGPGTFTVPSGGTLEWRSGYMTGVGGATNIAAGATLTIDGTSSKVLSDRALNNAGTGTFSEIGGLSVDQSAVFTNSGTFTIQNDSGIGVDPTLQSGTIVNTGTWTKTSPTGTGTTDITATFNNTGGTVVTTSGILQLDNHGTSTGTFNDPSSAGTLEITGRGYNLNAGTAFTGAGTFHFTSGFLGADLVNLNANVTFQNLAIDAGMISGTGSLTVLGTLSINNGTISTTGTVNINSGATLTMAGTSTATFDAGTFNNAGAASISGSESFHLTNGATFNNIGSFAILNDTGSNLGTFRLDNNTFFVNSGTLTKTSPVGTGSTTISSDTFTNRGTIDVASGQLVLDVTGTSTGAFTAEAGASLNFAGGWTLNAGTTMAGAGSFGIGIGFFGYGTITVNANLSAPNFAIPGGVLIVSASDTFTVNALNWTNGQITGPGTMAVPVGGTLAISGSSNKVLSSATLSNAGTATWTGTGPIYLDSGAVISNQAGGSFNATNDQLLGSGSGGTFNNAGTFTKTSLTGVGTTTITPQVNLLPGGAINLVSGNLTTSSLTNVGTINLLSQTVLTVMGNYIQPNAGRLAVTIGGAPATKLFGQIQAVSASLNGTLIVVRSAGFVPSAGQVTPILTYNSVVGNFTSINVETLGGTPLFVAGPKAMEYDLVANPTPTSTSLAVPSFTASFNQPVTFTAMVAAVPGASQPTGMVNFYDGSKLLGSSTLDGSGHAVFSTSTLSLGTHSITATYAGDANDSTSGSNTVPLRVGDATRSDFNGDGKSDIAIYDATDGAFFVLESGGGSINQPFGNKKHTNLPI